MLGIFGLRIVLSVTQGPATGQRLEFVQPDALTFGKASDARVVIQGDAEVSRNHFTLVIAPPRIMLCDHSSNGTYIRKSGTREFVRFGGRNPLPTGAIAAPDQAIEAELGDGDTVSVGQTRLSVSVESNTRLQFTPPELVEFPADVQGRESRVRKPSFRRTSHAGSTAIYSSKDFEQPPTFLEDSPHWARRLLQLPVSAPTFPGYRLIGKIGEGAMGVVVKAAQESTGRAVAIKIVTPRGNADSHALLLTALERELENHRKLAHPNVVEFIECVRAGPIVGVVTEYVDGPHLSEWARRNGGRGPLVEAWEVMSGALKGLAAAHAQGFVHRDLKPENILFKKTPSGWSTKIADLPVARTCEASGMSLLEVSGTPAHWPREHLTHYQESFPASDVFSIAAVFYEALCGRQARAGMTELLRARRDPGYADFVGVIMNNRITPMRAAAPEIPKPIAEVFDRALNEKELDQTSEKVHPAKVLSELRYAHAGEFLDALNEAFGKCRLR